MRATGVVGDEERSFLAKEGLGGEINCYLEAHPEREEDLMTVLSYFDPMNFANDVRCPTLVGLGLLDDGVRGAAVVRLRGILVPSCGRRRPPDFGGSRDVSL